MRGHFRVFGVVKVKEGSKEAEILSWPCLFRFSGFEQRKDERCLFSGHSS